MSRATIIFDEEIFQQLQSRAHDKKIPVAEYIRRLVALGLRVEAAAEKNNSSINEDEVLSLKVLWKSDLSWLLESLYLLRYLTRYLVDQPDRLLKNEAYTNELVHKAREKAEAYVNELIDRK